jgi:hypothetical protein
MDKHRDRIRYPAVIKSAGYLIRGILKQKTESRRSPSPDFCLLTSVYPPSLNILRFRQIWRRAEFVHKLGYPLLSYQPDVMIEQFGSYDSPSGIGRTFAISSQNE